MKNRGLLYLTVILFALTSSNAAWARGGHGHRHSHLSIGVGVGGYYPVFYGSGFYGPGFYGYRSYGYDPFFYRPYPYYNYPQTVVVPVTPPVYVQQEQSKPAEPKVNYWHYCRNPEGYYPYVRNCPDGWLQVAPQPPAQ